MTIAMPSTQNANSCSQKERGAHIPQQRLQVRWNLFDVIEGNICQQECGEQAGFLPPHHTGAVQTNLAHNHACSDTVITHFKLTWRGKALVFSSTKPGMRWLSMDAMLNSVPASREQTEQKSTTATA
jgi:hypothetical protein